MSAEPDHPTPGPSQRLAIIGGGMGGISTAFFCDSDWTIDLFEARPSLGGNASTIVVQDGDLDVVVDIGGESYHPGTHPVYWELLHELGAILPDGAPDDVRVIMPGTLSIFDAHTRDSFFVSTHPVRTPKYAISFYLFTRAARRFLAEDPSVDITIEEWLEPVRMDRTFKTDVLLPWLASLTCCSVEMVRTQSALAFLLQFVRVFPDNVLRSAHTHSSRIGLGGILQMMVDRCEHLSVHTDAAVTRMDQVDGSWFVETAGGRHGPYARVVVNAPPHASRAFLADAVPTGLLDVLKRHRYYPTRMLVHQDPIYMPANRDDWCSHNAAIFGDSCEATIWVGSSRTHPTTGEPIQVFKSWASNRPVQAGNVLAEQTFLHPALTPECLRAGEELARWQGVHGLHFTGHYTEVTDLQETALRSGLAAARTLSPSSPSVRSLDRRIGATGRAQLDVAAATPSSWASP